MTSKQGLNIPTQGGRAFGPCLALIEKSCTVVEEKLPSVSGDGRWRLHIVEAGHVGEPFERDAAGLRRLDRRAQHAGGRRLIGVAAPHGS